MPEATSPRIEYLAAEPASAGLARRFVTDALDTLGQGELVEVAALLVSEVVTNAVLHAGTEMVLRIEVTERRVRVEVADGSSVAPSLRHYDEAASTGRGLGLVEALATAWGIRRDGAGKTVWFELVPPQLATSVAGTPTTDDVVPMASAPVESASGRPVHLDGAPVRLLWATVQYGDALLREAALMAMADVQAGTPWHGPAVDLAPLLHEIKAAVDAGSEVADLVVSFPGDAAASVMQRLAVIDEADRMADEGLLLGPRALPEVGACRRWYLGEIARQLENKQPRQWEVPAAAATSANVGSLPADQREMVEQLATGAVVADNTNHIVYVNEEAADLLGWHAGDLTGQRLTVIIPPALRDAHLAGYTRYQVTGTTSIIGSTVEVPALRRDGSVVQVELQITILDGSVRGFFLARLRPTF